jgi:hypothetical protein
MPYVFGAVGFLYAATPKMQQQDPHGRDLCLYVAQWVNPHPEKVIRSIEVTGSAEAVPVVFAITGREVKQGGAAPVGNATDAEVERFLI